VLAKLLLATILGGAIGLEREMAGKPAGLRTNILICVGAALFTQLSIDIARIGFANDGRPYGDTGRIAAQIVSGVGFLGAGTIIQSRGAVRGLTTAAGLWVAAAIGIAIGARFYADATIVTAALLVILVALRPVERWLHHEQHALVVQLDPTQKLSDLTEVLDEARIDVEHMVRNREDSSVQVAFRGSRIDCQRLIDLCNASGLTVRDDGAMSSLMTGPA